MIFITEFDSRNGSIFEVWWRSGHGLRPIVLADGPTELDAVIAAEKLLRDDRDVLESRLQALRQVDVGLETATPAERLMLKR